MREPTIEEVRAAAASGAGSMETVRAANAYLRIRFEWACEERDRALILLSIILNCYAENGGGREGSTCFYVSDATRAEAEKAVAGLNIA